MEEEAWAYSRLLLLAGRAGGSAKEEDQGVIRAQGWPWGAQMFPEVQARESGEPVCRGCVPWSPADVAAPGRG